MDLMRVTNLHEDNLADIFMVGPINLIFAFTALLFNLLLVALFISQRNNRTVLTRFFGTIWLFLAIPLIIVFVGYWFSRRESSTPVSLGIAFLYVLVEPFLDILMKIEFRRD